MRTTVSVLACCVCVLGAGCTALVEGTLAGRGGDAGRSGMDTGPTPDTGPMVDSGPASPCNGLPNGAQCEVSGILEPFVCLAGICQLSRCGDGVPDMRMQGTHQPEECDDGNSIPGDGCETDCTYTCISDVDCDDGLDCNGLELCAPTHACMPGTPVPDSPPTTCTTAGGVMARCQGGVCRAGMCGDGTLDAGEECDDHNLMDGDGCQHDCTFTCVDDLPCQDGNACNGSEACDLTTHVCGAPGSGTALNCDDGDVCTADTCDPGTGCTNTPTHVDADGDGAYAIDSANPMCGGGDCNDADPNVKPGAPEPCGSTTDFNCDGVVGMTPTWYADCDADGFARAGAASVVACTAPSGTPTGCSSGGQWVSVPPGTGTTDCLDSNSSVRPNQTAWFSSNATGLPVAYDYNCSGAAQLEYPLYATSSSGVRGFVECQYVLARCTGSVYWVRSTAPSCGATGQTLSFCDRSCTRISSVQTTPVSCH